MSLRAEMLPNQDPEPAPNQNPLHVQRHHEESEDDEDDWTEDEDVSTPLDPIDPFVAFADTLASLQQHMPGRFEVR